MLEKDKHSFSVKMDKWTRIYAKWSGNKQKVRRAISSKFPAAGKDNAIAIE